MILRSMLFLSAVLTAGLLAAAESSHKFTPVKEVPKGLSAEIATLLDPHGHQLSGPDGPLCEIWLLKSIVTLDDFEPSLIVNYPLTPGQLVGALRIPKGAGYADFRGQDIAHGVYTLRYGQQPEDGNHLGTSETADFLLALPAKFDTHSKTIPDFDKLSEASAKSAGSTHPAIFSLLPAEEEVSATTLTHDEDREFWIADLLGKQKNGNIQIRLIVIGIAEE